MIASHGHPVPVVTPPRLVAAGGAASLWLLMRAFASGCTAMTGVEAVLFKDPPVAWRRTLTVLVAILGCFLGGVAYLALAYGIGAMNQEMPGYQSVLSSLIAAVIGATGSTPSPSLSAGRGVPLREYDLCRCPADLPRAGG